MGYKVLGWRNQCFVVKQANVTSVCTSKPFINIYGDAFRTRKHDTSNFAETARTCEDLDRTWFPPHMRIIHDTTCLRLLVLYSYFHFCFAPFGCNIVAFDIVDFQEPGIKYSWSFLHTCTHKTPLFNLSAIYQHSSYRSLSYPALFFLTKPKPEGPKHKSDDRQHRDAKSKCQ